jgi:signal transduction histidine kinase
MGQGMMAGMGNRLRLLDAQGAILLDTTDSENQGLVTQEELNNAIPIIIKQQTVGYLLPDMGMAITRGNEAKLVDRVNRAAIIAGLITAFLSLAIVSFLAYKLLQPVNELTLATERIAEGDLSQRVPVRGKDELATLGSAFNRMADSLENAENNRRVMTADIAHELRNPLAVQRANLEAMQDGIYDMTPENVQPLIDQNLLLTRLVEDMRTLAMADAGQLELVRVDTDFPALVKRVLERFQSQANTKNISMDLICNAACPPVSLDPGRIEQILGNLLSNAFRFSPESGKITLEITCAPQNVRLDVHDSGPGIPEEALPNLFQRFYRADKSRSRKEGGSGLGLAIARKIAEAHGGSLTAANHPQGGAVLSLTLPLTG